MLGISVARQHEISRPLTSLNKQRREVLGGGKDLESLGQSQGRPRVELLPSAKNRANDAGIVNLSMDNENPGEPHRMPYQVPAPIENVEPADMRQAIVG